MLLRQVGIAPCVTHTPNPFVCKLAQENSYWLHAMAAGSNICIGPACMQLLCDPRLGCLPVLSLPGIQDLTSAVDTASRTRNSCQWDMGVHTYNPSTPLKQEDSEFQTSPCFEKYIRLCANEKAIDEMARRPLKSRFWAWAFCCYSCF